MFNLPVEHGDDTPTLFEYRIVLERPEYGYATYFFELLDSVPISWQIKRLVTAMKLTSCSRVTLMENKALMVFDLKHFSVFFIYFWSAWYYNFLAPFCRNFLVFDVSWWECGQLERWCYSWSGFLGKMKQTLFSEHKFVIHFPNALFHQLLYSFFLILSSLLVFLVWFIPNLVNTTVSLGINKLFNLLKCFSLSKLI